MSSVFIIAEDLVNYIKDDSLEEGLLNFILNREDLYQQGTFKKVFRLLKENVKT